MVTERANAYSARNAHMPNAECRLQVTQRHFARQSNYSSTVAHETTLSVVLPCGNEPALSPLNNLISQHAAAVYAVKEVVRVNRERHNDNVVVTSNTMMSR